MVDLLPTRAVGDERPVMRLIIVVGSEELVALALPDTDAARPTSSIRIRIIIIIIIPFRAPILHQPNSQRHQPTSVFVRQPQILHDGVPPMSLSGILRVGIGMEGPLVYFTRQGVVPRAMQGLAGDDIDEAGKGVVTRLVLLHLVLLRCATLLRSLLRSKHPERCGGRQHLVSNVPHLPLLVTTVVVIVVVIVVVLVLVLVLPVPSPQMPALPPPLPHDRPLVDHGGVLQVRRVGAQEDPLEHPPPSSAHEQRGRRPGRLGRSAPIEDGRDGRFAAGHFENHEEYQGRHQGERGRYLDLLPRRHVLGHLLDQEAWDVAVAVGLAVVEEHSRWHVRIGLGAQRE
mmetsp:Transcript_6864/g.19193  ORF Transcript_6864/g.19193 Transcript_6864/m.19193 type:complete len:343 (-) Transcript_6864:226-1254(-)